MTDWRASWGASLIKFFKIGRLTFGSSSGLDSLFREPKVENVGAYQTHVWAYKGISAIASAAASIPIKVVSVKSDGAKPQEITDHPFEALLENPNPFMTRIDLVEYLLIFLELTGEGYWLFDDGSDSGRMGKPYKLGQVKELWPLLTQTMEKKADDRKFISGYNFKPFGAGKGEPLDVSEVFRVAYPSPFGLLEAANPINPVKADIANDLWMNKFEKFVMRNLGVDTIFLKTANAFTPDQRQEYKRSLGQVFKGTRIGFMESGLDFAVPQLTAADLPLTAMDKRRERRVLGALGVPPIMVGSEDAKYDNATQQMAFFWGNTMVPKLARIESMLTKMLHALGEKKNIRVKFDTSEVRALEANQKVRSETAKSWYGMGVPINDLIAVFGADGMEDIEGGDVPMVNASLIPLLDAQAEDELPIEPEGTPEDASPPGSEPEPSQEPGEEEGREVTPMTRASSASQKKLDTIRWKRFIVQQTPGYKRIRAAWRKLFKEQRKVVLAAMKEKLEGEKAFGTKAPQVEIELIDLLEANIRAEELLLPIITSIYTKFAKDTIADIGVDISFNINDPHAVKFLETHLPKIVDRVNRLSADKVSKIIQDGFNEGLSVNDMAKNIRKLYKDMDKFRAVRIARTESGIASNKGIMDGMRQAGVETKRWITARDGDVRDSHQIEGTEGGLVGAEEPFILNDGVMLDQPGDSSLGAGPENVVNCRCVVAPGKVKK